MKERLETLSSRSHDTTVVYDGSAWCIQLAHKRTIPGNHCLTNIAKPLDDSNDLMTYTRTSNRVSQEVRKILRG